MNKLFHGKETFLSRRAVKKTLDSLVKDLSAEKISIDAEKADQAEILDILNTNSLFASERVIFLKRPYKNKKKATFIPNLLDYLKKETPNTHVVIWEDQKIKSNTKYFKYFQSQKSAEEFPELNKRTFITWARDEVENSQIDLDNNLIKILSERVNFSTESFSNEINKLKLSGKRIFKIEDIMDTTTDTLEYDIWKLIDSINSQKTEAERIEILERILSQEVDANYIISMLARNLRLTTEIKDLLENNKNYSEIASLLKIPPFTIPQMKNTAQKYTREKISLLYEKLASLDYEIKRGRIDPNLGLTLLITKF